jgi:hypothetical protein
MKRKNFVHREAFITGDAMLTRNLFSKQLPLSTLSSEIPRCVRQPILDYDVLVFSNVRYLSD